MPIFEYTCRDCGHRFELLHSADSTETVKCPSCGSTKTDKLLSAFAGRVTGSSGSGCGGSSSGFS
ncbi:MAG: zinc ribbon domain-containing protein [candidate division Zixibacteria bacterium]|nr:zinc ribbon domain-containing protein [candidate division Zixibacteria bacterium]